jgi:hypothetical protein
MVRGLSGRLNAEVNRENGADRRLPRCQRECSGSAVQMSQYGPIGNKIKAVFEESKRRRIQKFGPDSGYGPCWEDAARAAVQLWINGPLREAFKDHARVREMGLAVLKVGVEDRAESAEESFAKAACSLVLDVAGIDPENESRMPSANQQTPDDN